MRISLLVTVATLAVPRDSTFAQNVSVMIQAIPVVTRADPTAARSVLTEGYLSQPMIMAHGSLGWLRARGTLNLEGLTLERGELSTGAYGESYVDRRHPHAYVHELLAGVEPVFYGVAASLFAGRGFAPATGSARTDRSPASETETRMATARAMRCATPFGSADHDRSLTDLRMHELWLAGGGALGTCSPGLRLKDHKCNS
jgi:hypothetical protein